MEIDIHDFKVAKTTIPNSPFLPMVDIALTENGRKKLAELSSRDLKRRVAVFLDGKLLVVPIIIEPLTIGILRISGDFDRAEIQNITDPINVLISEARVHGH
ncbi:MAG TPA: hypothetical protein VIW47_04410 [Nitrospiraceae bacterium]